VQYRSPAPDSERSNPSDGRSGSRWFSASSWRPSDDRRRTELAHSPFEGNVVQISERTPSPWDGPFARPSSVWSHSSSEPTMTLPPSMSLTQSPVPRNRQSAPSEPRAVSVRTIVLSLLRKRLHSPWQIR
jgi:hypothetical protein